MKKILVPTDFSSNARHALRYAIDVFGPEVQIVLLNAYEEPASTTTSMIALKDILHEASRKSLQEERDKAMKEFAGSFANIETASVYGGAMESVRGHAKKHQVDAVVMGSKGATGLKEVFAGSVASSVAINAGVPVFVVPEGYHVKDTAKVVIALEPGKNGLSRAGEWVNTVLGTREGTVAVLTVNADDAEVRAVRPNWQYPTQYVNITGDDIDDAIEEFAEETDTDLVIVFPKHKGFLERLFKGSVSQSLARHLDMPLLAIPEKGD